jgi:UDPglucose--hexose-1-phosphate uridylyltransferase
MSMSELRLNPLTGRWVAVATGRTDRPGDLVSRQLPVEAEPGRPCPFCPGNEEAMPPALETYDRHGRWVVRVVPNRFPAFEGDEPLEVRNLGPVFTQAPATGIHEVLVFSPDHAANWADLDDAQVAVTMAAIRDRMEDHSHRRSIRYTQMIVNHGREAGASLEHPHGQLLGIPFVPGEITDELAGFRRFAGSCLLCTAIDAEESAGHRVLHADKRVLVVCPYWSGTPYEMLVLPRRHEAHVTEASPSDVVAVGRAVRTAVDRLRGALGSIAYNLVFHTAPHQHTDLFHWHVHVLPRVTSVAGFEQGTGVMIDIVSPEAAAKHLTVTG